MGTVNAATSASAPPPRVVIDATSIPQNRGGVGRYLEQLLPRLGGTAGRYTVIAKSEDLDWLTALAPDLEVVAGPASISRRPVRLLWEQFGLPARARALGADVIFSPHYTVPLFTRRARVVTFHDATFFSLPDVHTRLKRLFFRTWIRLAGRLARIVVVPSQATADEVVRWAGVDAGRVRVAWHGIDRDLFHPPTDEQVAAAREQIGSSHWVAFLGTLEPRKNLPNLVRAFGAVVDDPDVRAAFPDLILALAGGRGWDAELDATIAASAHADRILRLGFVPDDALPGLLGGAVVVAYPSLGEGFGLPVAEAMGAGAAVLTTPELSLSEVGGDAVRYTAPDADAIASALRDLLTHPDEVAELRTRGVERARAFDWPASAEVHAQAFAAARRA